MFPKALWQHETALGSPPCGHKAHTYTHTPFFQRPGTTWTSPSLFPGLSLWSPNPGTRRRITRTARVRKPSAENRSHIQNFAFPRSSACVAYPRHTTHIRAFAFPSCYHDCPEHDHLLLCLRLFDYPFSDSWCPNLWNPAPDFLEFTLFRFDELTVIR